MATFRDPPLSADYVRSLFRYEPETGLLIRIAGHKSWIGTVAGCGRHGYQRVKIGYRSVAAHRIAWVIVTGEWPAVEIDHIDLNKSNNRWSNLRLATHSENQSNCRAYSCNTTGVKGVYPAPHTSGKYISAIRKNGKRRHLGTFLSVQEAGAAYERAVALVHGEFGRAS